MEEEYMKEDLTNPDKDTESGNESQNETQLMYCGPNIPSRGLFSYQVFTGGFPFNVRELIEEIPEIGKLMTPINEVDDVRRRCAIKGEIEHLYYERIKGKVIK